MPDNDDYGRFDHMLRHPEEWSPRDRLQMDRSLRQQRDLLRAAHPKDAKGRARLENALTQVEIAIARYDDIAPI